MDEDRETRRQERELRKLEMEAELARQKEAAEAAKTEHELELARLAAANGSGRTVEREDRAKAPKLPSFVDGKDDLDAYLQRFERFVETAKWRKLRWMGIEAQCSIVWTSARSVFTTIGGRS